jgi:thymidylate synthase (methanogen type)
MVELNVSTISDSWVSMLREIILHGSNVEIIVDGNSYKTLELYTPMVVNISNVFSNMIPVGSKWHGKSIEKYRSQVVNGDNVDGFDYDYHTRLHKWHGTIDQIGQIITNLKNNSNSRQEIATLWEPNNDLIRGKSVPCWVLADFKLREQNLNLTVIYRSWDIYGAAPSNMYAIAGLLEMVANELHCEAGRLTIICSAAHIYEYDIPSARRIIGEVP